MNSVDAAQPHRPERLAVAADPHQRHRVLLLELPGARVAIRVEDAVGKIQDHGHREVARRPADVLVHPVPRVGEYDLDVALARDIEVDRVLGHAAVHQHHALQVWVRTEDVTRNQVAPHNEQIVGPLRSGDQLVLAQVPVQARKDVDVRHFAHQVKRDVRNRLHHKYFRLHDSPPKMIRAGTRTARPQEHVGAGRSTFTEPVHRG